MGSISQSVGEYPYSAGHFLSDFSGDSLPLPSPLPNPARNKYVFINLRQVYTVKVYISNFLK